MSSGTVLVIGGAGYIGSHTCLALAQKGYNPVVFDNFSIGHREFVKWGAVIEGDIRIAESIEDAVRAVSPLAIVHFAALTEVGHSTKKPSEFYLNNVAGTLNVLRAAMRIGNCPIVFSSTCATYGIPGILPITEDTTQAPINPYGRTKLAAEMAISDYCQYEGLSAVILRYFNAAGADFECRIGEWHEPETHVIPVAIDVSLGRRENFTVFGNDYETPDGTCIRDYIHVLDLADAHVRAVDYLLDGGSPTAINLGTGTGTSVLEMVQEVEKVSGRSLNVRWDTRRPGDPPSLVADNAKAAAVLGWKPVYTMADIVRSAYAWHSRRNT